MPLKHNSPSARLLRSSRLFSMPPPIRSMAELDPNDLKGFSRASETATDYHPTHQAITTPRASLARGDWGLKRPLPTRTTTKTSNPILRVQALDTVERITDFGSASGHALTVRKWHEMGMPLSISEARSPRHVRESAFDHTVDNTTVASKQLKDIFDADRRTQVENLRKQAQSMNVALPEDDASQKDELDAASDIALKVDLSDTDHGVQERLRWKHNGPWLGAMSNYEFEVWLREKVLNHSGPFMEELREQFRKEIIHRRKMDALQDGKPMDPSKEVVTKEDISREIRWFRKGSGQPDSRSSLIIRQFLDLPGFEKAGQSADRSRIGNEGRRPPRTHPSAGLSYLRTSAYLDNHPLLGPQEQQAPVSSRLVQVQLNNQRKAMLGVAGVVVNDQNMTRPNNRDSQNQSGQLFASLDSRHWVRPFAARIASSGRIILDVKAPDKRAVAVRQGNLGAAVTPQKPESRAQGFDQRLDGF